METIQGISSYQYNLIWTSMRYCLPRHSYVSDYAYDIAKNDGCKMSGTQKKNLANNIRQEIFNHLTYVITGLETNSYYNGMRPLEMLLSFMKKEGITRPEDFNSYCDIRFTFDEKEQKVIVKGMKDLHYDNIKTVLSSANIDDMIPWMELAAYLDTDNYVTVHMTNGEIVKAFESWTHELTEHKNSNGEVSYTLKPFEWKKVYIPIKLFAENPYKKLVINQEMVSCIE